MSGRSPPTAHSASSAWSSCRRGTTHGTRCSRPGPRARPRPRPAPTTVPRRARPPRPGRPPAPVPPRQAAGRGASVRRILLATAAILAAVLIQVTVLDNVPLPGGAGPNLVLVAVVAMALATGPRDGAIIGFAAGLALDIAPPASGLLGQGALVFCLVGYGCGR